MPNVLEELVIFEVTLLSGDLLESVGREKESPNVLDEVVEVEVQVEAGSVMVSKVYTRQEAMNPGKEGQQVCLLLTNLTKPMSNASDTCCKRDDDLRPCLLDQESWLTSTRTTSTSRNISRTISCTRGQILI